MARLEKREVMLLLAREVGADPADFERLLNKYEIVETLFISEPGYFQIQFQPIGANHGLGNPHIANRVTISTRVSESGKCTIDRGNAIGDESSEKDLLMTALALIPANNLSVDPELLAVAKSALEIMNI